MKWEFKCPKKWIVLQKWGEGFALRQKDGGLHVIIDCEEKSDGYHWIHVSVSRYSYTPTHADMALVKHDFIGDSSYAYSVWPPADKYVNIHKYCLHIWSRLDDNQGQVLPEFSAELPIIGTSI